MVTKFQSRSWLEFSQSSGSCWASLSWRSSWRISPLPLQLFLCNWNQLTLLVWRFVQIALILVCFYEFRHNKLLRKITIYLFVYFPSRRKHWKLTEWSRITWKLASSYFLLFQNVLLLKRTQVQLFVIDQARGQDPSWILAKFIFCVFLDRDGVKVHKHTTKKLSAHPTILTKQAWPIKDKGFIVWLLETFFFLDTVGCSERAKN